MSGCRPKCVGDFHRHGSLTVWAEALLGDVDPPREGKNAHELVDIAGDLEFPAGLKFVICPLFKISHFNSLTFLLEYF